MATLDERYQQGLAMRAKMAAGDPTHYTLPGIDQLAPDLKRIIDESLFGSIWTRPNLAVEDRSICTLSALMAMGHLHLLRRHLERAHNMGVKPEQLVEIFVQLTFYVGVPSVETGMRILKEFFEEQGIQYTPTRSYDTQQTPEQLHQKGVAVHTQHMGDITRYHTQDPNSEEMQLDRLLNEYHWGAIYPRPHLDDKQRAICALSAMTVMGHYDRQLRGRIVGALGVGLTPAQIMEVFIQLTMYGGYFNTRTAMTIARSVFAEQGLPEGDSRYRPVGPVS